MAPEGSAPTGWKSKLSFKGDCTSQGPRWLHCLTVQPQAQQAPPPQPQRCSGFRETLGQEWPGADPPSTEPLSDSHSAGRVDQSPLPPTIILGLPLIHPPWDLAPLSVHPQHGPQNSHRNPQAAHHTAGGRGGNHRALSKQIKRPCPLINGIA